MESHREAQNQRVFRTLQLEESRKYDGVTISGLVRKHLSEIEQRMVEGESRDRVLAWLKEKTGRAIERTAFLSAFYRARKWAEKNKIKAAYLAALSAQPVQSVAPEPAILPFFQAAEILLTET